MIPWVDIDPWYVLIGRRDPHPVAARTGPLLGNGDMGVGLGGIAASPDMTAINQTFYVGKMDFWTQQNDASGLQGYFAHVAPGHVTMAFGKVGSSSPAAPLAPAPPPPTCTHKNAGGYCQRPNTIPCINSSAECSAFGRMAGTTVAEVQAACDADPKCHAYGIYSSMWEHYFNPAEILHPFENPGWDLFYKNATCCYAAARPLPPPPPPLQFSATQELFAARVNATVGSGSSSRCGNITSSSVVHPDENVMVSRFRVGKACTMSISLQSPNMYGLPVSVGATPDSTALWMLRQNNKWVNNDATVVECVPNVVNSASLRYFQMPIGDDGTLVAGPVGALRNWTASATDAAMCMWLGADSAEHQPHQSRVGGFVSIAECGTPGTDWHFDPHAGTLTSLSDRHTCVGYWVGPAFAGPSARRVISPVSCDAAGRDGSQWAVRFNVTALERSTGFGMFTAALAGRASVLDPRALDPTPPCLGIVRQNINISVAMAVSLSGGSAGTLMAATSTTVTAGDNTQPACAFPRAGIACADVYSSTGSFDLAAGIEYVLRIAITSTRGPGIEPRTSALATALRTASTSDPVTVEHSNAESWSRWWAASTVSLGAQRQLLESFWYGSQYMLNCFTKNETGGGVIPGLRKTSPSYPHRHRFLASTT